MKKFLIVFVLILYSMLNFANFSQASVCFTKNQVSVNFFGVDKCCSQHIYESIASADNDILAICEKKCSDTNLYTNIIELYNSSSIDIASLDSLQTEIKEINLYNNLYPKTEIIYISRENRYSTALDMLKTVKLTI